jgi:GDPmannose 4,6-dehydratase
LNKALITGITGQDGSYLAELLLDKSYEVHGLIRRSSSFNTQRINHIYKDPHNHSETNLNLHYGDVTDMGSLLDLIYNIQPSEIYHLAAQSHVRVSFDLPEYTGDVTALGTIRMLEAIRKSGIPTRFYQASSSEMFGNPTEIPQSETTPFHPRNPYGMAKLYAHWATVNYRQRYSLFAVSGIMFNHESPRRPEMFVTRKVTRAAARIKVGLEHELQLGNLDGQRDWGFAGDYVEAMWMILQKDQPDDFVIGTGQIHTVRDLLDQAFSYANLDWHEYVKVDPTLFRKEKSILRADISKAKRMLGWKPHICFQELIRIMVEKDLKLVMSSD